MIRKSVSKHPCLLEMCLRQLDYLKKSIVLQLKKKYIEN